MSERLHFRGLYIIRMERKGSAFVYDVLKKSDRLLVASGVDMSSSSESAAVDEIAKRFGVDAFEQSFNGDVCRHH